MSIVLTYWEDPINKTDPDEYEGLFSIPLKSVKQIPELIAHRPPKCTMISTERTADLPKARKMEKIGRLHRNPRSFTIRWEKGQTYNPPLFTKCPLCGKEK